MYKWIRVKISDLGQVVGGATPSTNNDEYYNGDIIWITPKDLSNFNGRYILKGERNITRAGMESCSTQMLPKGSILFSSRAPIGYVAIAAREMCTNQGFKSVIPNETVDYLFLFYLLKYNRDKIESMGSGTTFKEVSGSTMKNIEVTVPESIEIQRKIAGILNSIDSKIENNIKINDNLEQQAQAMVSEYAERTLYSSVFSDIMNFDNGFAFQSSTYLPSGKYKIITIKNVQDGYIDSTGSAFIDSLPQRMKDNCILNIGDVLLSLTGNVGRVGIVCEENLLLNQRVAKIVPIDNKLLPFLYFVFRQSGIKTKLETIAKGTAQLNLSPIETLKLTIPYEERSAVQLSQQLEPLYRKIINNNQESYSFALLRDTLLPKLMSGEIDVSAVQL